MAKGKPVEQVASQVLPPAAPPVEEQKKVEVNQGNVPVVTVQLLNDINQKLRRILEIMEKNG
jgi:hypothetical protein